MMITTTDCEESPSLKRKATESQAYSCTEAKNTIRIHSSKRRKLSSCRQSGSRHRQSPDLEHTLQKPLTRANLKELDEKNRQKDEALVKLPAIVEPVSRQEAQQLLQPAEEYLESCGTETLNSLILSASDGGPVLLDLRGVSFVSGVAQITDEANKSVSCIKCKKQRTIRHHYPLADCSQSHSHESESQTFSSDTTSSGMTTSSTRSGPRNPRFEQKLVDGGVYNDCSTYPGDRTQPQPANWDYLLELIERPRLPQSPSPLTEETFRKFKAKDKKVTNETDVIGSLYPIISGENEEGPHSPKSQAFNNFDPLLDDDTIKAATTDIYYGSHTSNVDKKIRDQLDGLIVPCTNDTFPIIPNFSIEAKGPDGKHKVALLQACYAGAVGVRAMHALRTYALGEEIFDDKAYAVTAILTGSSSILELYASHITRPTRPDGRPEYHMNKLGSYSLTHRSRVLNEGITAFRNLRDWAKEQRDELVDLANRRCRRSLIQMSGSGTTRSSSGNDGECYDESDENGENDDSDGDVDDAESEEEVGEEDSGDEYGGSELVVAANDIEEKSRKGDGGTPQQSTKNKKRYRGRRSTAKATDSPFRSDSTDELTMHMNCLTPTKMPLSKRSKGSR